MMRIAKNNPPHIRTRETAGSMYFDVTLALTALYAMAIYFYGPRAAMLGGVCAGTCMLCETLTNALARKKRLPGDASALLTGLILALLFPAAMPYTTAAAAAAFASLLAKAPFGGTGSNIFNPAAAGWVFAAAAYPQYTFRCTAPLLKLPLWGEITARSVPSALHTIRLGGVPSYDLLDVLLGNVPGAMGCTHALVLLTCLLYLFARRCVSLALSGSFLVGAAVVAVALPRAGMGTLVSAPFELGSGMLLFAGVFLLSDPTTSPKRIEARLVYGFVGGVLAMLLRAVGRLDETVPITLLFMNTLVWPMDLLAERYFWKGRAHQ